MNTEITPFPSLLTDLLEWAEEESKRQKVSRIYMLAILRRKFKLAERIERKYHNYLPKSDLAMAFRLSLIANSHKPK